MGTVVFYEGKFRDLPRDFRGKIYDSNWFCGLSLPLLTTRFKVENLLCGILISFIYYRLSIFML